MRLRPEQLSHHLSRGLAALYLIYGDEPLLVQEAADAIRGTARERGYSERECLTVATGFDWNILLQTSANLSLFSNRRILELQLGNTKPGDTGSQVLTIYAERPPDDTVLLITCAKLDSAAQKSVWFSALNAAGITIPVWPVEMRQLPAWIERRLRNKGLQPSPEAVALLAERVEGNLLAAAQEIDKLHILFGSGPVSADEVLAVVGDNARFSIYDLADAALTAQAERTVRILNGLRGEGVEIILVLWALHREIKLLTTLRFELDRGQSLEMILTRYKLWEKRKPLLRQALQRLSYAECRRLLQQCARVDCLIKGVERGEPWDALLNLSLALAGQNVVADLRPNLVNPGA